MTTRSAKARSDQELAVAVAAKNRRGDRAEHHQACFTQEARDIVTNGAMHRLIAHESFLDVRAAGFELRLDQRDNAAAGPQKLDSGPEGEFQRDEAEVRDEKVYRLGDH